MPTITKIFIIQSLKTTDQPKVGEELYKKLQGLVQTSLSEISTRNELFADLDLIKDEVKQSSGQYIIHFHCHGNEDGIGIFDKSDSLDFISWETLRIALRNIFIASGHKIIVSFCSCEGFNAMKLIAGFEPCPYYLITGSLEKIGFNDSVDAYYLYYKNFNEGKSAIDNIGEVNRNYPSVRFLALPAVELFELAWKGYFNTQLTPEKVALRKEQIKSEIIAIAGRITQEQENLIDKGLTEETARLDYERFKNKFLS